MIFSGLSLVLFVLLMSIYTLFFCSFFMYSKFEYAITAPSTPTTTVFNLKW